MAEIASLGVAERLRRRKLKLDSLWLALPGLGFLALFLILPTVQMLSLSFLDKVTGALSLSAFARIWNGGPYLAVLSTTFSVALWTTALCVGLGYPLAYWLSRKPPRQQRIAALFVLLPFWTSALIKNFSWLVLLGRNGIIAKTMAAIGVSGGDQLLFGRTTVVFAMVHTLLPLAVVTMLPVMNQIDRRLMMAASTLGANSSRAFWRVFFQLSIRGAAAAGLLVLVASLGFFITPALVGGARDTMIGQLIILQINELQNWQLGSALATILLISTIATCFVYDWIFGLSSATTGGERPTRPDDLVRRAGLAIVSLLGLIFGRIEEAWKRNVRGLGSGALLSIYAWTMIAMLLVPIIAFIPMAFTGSTFLSFPPPSWSLRWFEQFAASPLWLGAMVRSFSIGFAAAAITLVFAAMAALGVARTRSRLGSVAFLLCLSPMMVPSIVIAIALFYLFARISLVASDVGIIIGHTVIAMPVVFMVMLATFKGYDWNLDAAASTLGAGRLRIFWRVTLPLVASGLAVGFVTGFLQSFEELTVALFIGGGIKTTLPKQMWDGVLLQVSPVIAAASVGVLIVVIVMFAIIELVQDRRLRSSG
ncbi:ABC transporter permease [Bradyrhizobium sp. LTSPM299]|uniref:ABC transporter permease subunit n=1 Tax=Bradyrhizobium sp. LTSPM299 TaxID=1619233 RepID=UPI0005CB240B|nr:ABC transporter permease subunit [Bradyrhizobium sp. LTSPM299]KJC56066.1 ABC transporter permease [Bradyrhizobium sp. LTSPM299]